MRAVRGRDSGGVRALTGGHGRLLEARAGDRRTLAEPCPVPRLRRLGGLPTPAHAATSGSDCCVPPGGRLAKSGVGNGVGEGAIRGVGAPRLAVQVAIAYPSGRGHVAKLVGAVAEGVHEVPEATAALRALDALTAASWELLDRANALVFGCPTSMGGVSAIFKAFAEQSLRLWLDNLRWQNKMAARFTHSQAMSGDTLHSLQYFTILAAQHGMRWVTLDLYLGWCSSTEAITDLNRLGAWLGVISQADRDAAIDMAPNAGDLQTARHLGRREACMSVHSGDVGARTGGRLHGAGEYSTPCVDEAA